MTTEGLRMHPILARRPEAAPHPRRLAGEALSAALRDSRRRVLALVADLADAQWQVPRQDGINPIAWELAHLAWFAEFWILRGPHRAGNDSLMHAVRPARIAGPDTLFDSARLAHDDRWSVPLPGRAQVLDTLAGQLEACLHALPPADDDAALYFHRLALFHEDMHAEALVWLRASLGYPAPAGLSLPRRKARAPLHVPAAQVRIGGEPAQGGFAFDNELPGKDVALAAFEIDAQPVTAGEFLRFVESGGYADPACWRGDAAAWRAAHPHARPSRWRRAAEGAWQTRWFDRWVALDADAPVIHVNAFEAEAYCAWAGRRLPTAAEWEHGAAHEGFAWGGSVWEWTADPFGPHPGFVAGPYKDYSAPWFHSHRELRGGAFATHARLQDPRYRNFFMPHRTDVFAGFRTASVDR